MLHYEIIADVVNSSLSVNEVVNALTMLGYVYCPLGSKYFGYASTTGCIQSIFDLPETAKEYLPVENEINGIIEYYKN